VQLLDLLQRCQPLLLCCCHLVLLAGMSAHRQDVKTGRLCNGCPLFNPAAAAEEEAQQCEL
jgi:hypothetical protein